jgi:hypothetical protein
MARDKTLFEIETGLEGGAERVAVHKGWTGYIQISERKYPSLPKMPWLAEYVVT